MVKGILFEGALMVTLSIYGPQHCTAPHYKGVSVMDNNCLCVLCIFKGKSTPRLLSVVVGHDDQVDELLLAAVLGKDLGPQDLLHSDIYFCFPASDKACI